MRDLGVPELGENSVDPDVSHCRYWQMDYTVMQALRVIPTRSFTILGNSPVFRTLTSSLTVLALLAHALLGCCWHHRHEHGDHAALCEAEEHAVHAPHAHACCAGGNGHAEHDAHDSPLCLDSSPCSHPHTCTGLACSYLAAKVLKVQGLESRGYLSQSSCLTVVDPALARSRNLGSEPITPGPDSSVSRCALLQTWQV